MNVQNATTEMGQASGIIEREVVGVAEVAEMMGVSTKSVNRYAKAGIIPSFTTPGGHHRFYLDEVQDYMRESVKDAS